MAEPTTTWRITNDGPSSKKDGAFHLHLRTGTDRTGTDGEDSWRITRSSDGGLGQTWLSGALSVTGHGRIEELVGKSGQPAMPALSVRGTLAEELSYEVRVDATDPRLVRRRDEDTDLRRDFRAGDAIAINGHVDTVARVEDAGAEAGKQLNLKDGVPAEKMPRGGVKPQRDSALLVVQNGAGEAKLVVDKSGHVTATSFAGAIEARHLQGTLLVAKVDGLQAALDNKLNTSGGTITDALSFGSTRRQMINLYSPGYGIGIQDNTQYFRTNKNFAWYKGGGHADGELTPGTNGTVQMVIKDGNLGIGTNDPGPDKLKVQGSTLIDGDLKVSIGKSVRFDLQNGGKLSIGPGTFEVDAPGVVGGRFVVTDGGNVGIGTVKPDARLEIKKTVANGASEDLLILDSNNGGAGAGTAILFRNAAAPELARITGIDLGQWGGALVFQTNAAGNGAGNRLTERMRIDMNGNVGIGTNDPGTDKLKVQGNALIDGNLKVSIGKSVRFDLQNGGKLSLGPGAFEVDAPGVVGGRFIVTDGGNVGIGRADPTNALHVAVQKSVRFELGANQKLSLGGSGTLEVDAPGVVGGRFVVTEQGNVGIGTGNLQVKGKVYAEGGLVFYWGPDRVWRGLDNRSGNLAGTHDEGAPSDIRFKTAVRPVRNALEKVLHLRGTVYRWGDPGLTYFTRNITNMFSAGPNATEEENQRLWAAKRQEIYDALAGERIGLVAQEVETIVPEVILEDEEGYKYIQYQQLTALLVEAIKEQNELIWGLSVKVAALEAL